LHTHLNHGKWEECATEVQSQLNSDAIPPTIDLLPQLLTKIPILLFTGEFDLMVNHIGISYLVNNFTRTQPSHRLKVTNPDNGQWQNWGIDPSISDGQLIKFDNLIQVIVYNASHMASYNRPISVSSLMRWFINGRSRTKLIPEPSAAPGFFFVTNTTTKQKGSSAEQNVKQGIIGSLADGENTSAVPSSTMWIGVFIAFGVLTCLIIGLIRSRLRNPFRPDQQELLADETEMDTTQYRDPSPDEPNRRSGDEYEFEFQDQDQGQANLISNRLT